MDHASGVPTLSRWGLSNQVDIMRNDDCKPKSATEFGVDLMEVDGVDRAPQCWRRDMDLASGVSTLRRWGMSNQVDIMRNDDCKPKSATEYGVDLMEVAGVNRAQASVLAPRHGPSFV